MVRQIIGSSYFRKFEVKIKGKRKIQKIISHIGDLILGTWVYIVNCS